MAVDQRLVDLARSAHGAETAADAQGKVLTLSEDLHVPPGPWDSVVSICQLWASPDLGQHLARIRDATTADSRLLFCEPTGAGGPGSGPPLDITGEFWAARWSIIDTQRFVVRQGRHRHLFVRGIARHQR